LPIRAIINRPIRLEGLATWDGGKTTWGGRVEATGTVLVCVCAQESWGEGTGVLARKTSKGTVWDYYMAMIRNNLGWKLKDFKEDVYVQALQVKHPIIDRKVYTKRHRSYWKIIRLRGISACYQFFIDLLKQLDKEDLNQLCDLVKDYLSIRPATSEKEMELWVELKRLYEPDPEDQLWTQTQKFIHSPVEWKLYDLCGVHQVTAKDKDIFMLVKKDYPLRKGLALG
nr:hypothetical protein [Tanacetum cinerariifolium]